MWFAIKQFPTREIQQTLIDYYGAHYFLFVQRLAIGELEIKTKWSLGDPEWVAAVQETLKEPGWYIVLHPSCNPRPDLIESFLTPEEFVAKHFSELPEWVDRNLFMADMVRRIEQTVAEVKMQGENSVDLAYQLACPLTSVWFDSGSNGGIHSKLEESMFIYHFTPVGSPQPKTIKCGSCDFCDCSLPRDQLLWDQGELACSECLKEIDEAEKAP